MLNAGDILGEIRRVAPPGVREFDGRTRARLRRLAADLVRASLDAQSEFRRYLQVTDRGIRVPYEQVTRRLAGRTVLVTGACGCIGSALVPRIANAGPARLVAVDTAPGAQCRVDIRDRQALLELFDQVRPDLVFHLAAQRDPGLAEREVHRTVTTNVLGTRNVLDACAATGTGRLVFASTGKALRPYTADVYAASKRAAELLVTDHATRGIVRASAVRFTHVVDNSIVLDRFRRWCAAGETLRVHAPESVFYVQSALESAQLLLVAALSDNCGAMDLYGIRDLDWPVSPLDLAIGVMTELGPAPLHITGYDPGYEQQAYPGLYDPAFSGGVSPMFNAIEAPGAVVSRCAEVDVVTNRISLPADARRRIGALEGYDSRDEPGLRAALDGLLRELLDVVLSQAPVETLTRIAAHTRPHRPRMNSANRMIDDRVRWFAGLGAQAQGVSAAS